MESSRKVFWGKWVVYPWLLALYPVLYLYSVNVALVSVSDAAEIALYVLAGATVTFTALRFTSGSAPAAGVLTSIGALAFLLYGHIYLWLRDMGVPVRHSYLMVAAVLVVTVPVVVVLKLRESMHLLTGILNVVSVGLLLLPLLVIGRYFYAISRPDVRSLVPFAEGGMGSTETDVPRDIYYIILDTYPRADYLQEAYGYDNSAFVDALEARGFYVASGSRSNYVITNYSLASSLNMTYLEEHPDVEDYSVGVSYLEAAIQDNVIGHIVKSKGYVYVHISTGHGATAGSAVADVHLDFSPAGIQAPAHILKYFDERGRDATAPDQANELIPLFLQTTALRPIWDTFLYVRWRPEVPYIWYAPERTLAEFDAVAAIPRWEASTFTFFHVMLPHHPFMFDRYGNVIPKPPGWMYEDDMADPDKDALFIDQLIFLNELVLNTVDEILERSDVPPIIIIQGDHGSDGEPELRSHILNAYYFPDGGADQLYPSISPVNSFRVMLNYYFGADLELLEDASYRAQDEHPLVFEELGTAAHD